jgi:pantetheine-phosphate adenylyltransferase
MKRVGIYPGTFDPITFGHLDIVQRATRLVDHLIVAVARNESKGPLFSVDERVQQVRLEVGDLGEEVCDKIEVKAFDTLLVNFAREHGAIIIFRGMRAVSDFEYEFQMACTNARLDGSIDTAFLMSTERYQFISSRFVKEIGRLGGDISDFVSARIAGRVRERFGVVL